MPLSGAQEGGLVGAKNQKPSHWGLVLVNEMQGGSYLGGVDLVGVGETRLEVVGVPDELQEGEVGLVVLTFTCSFPSFFTLFFLY